MLEVAQKLTEPREGEKALVIKKITVNTITILKKPQVVVEPTSHILKSEATAGYCLQCKKIKRKKDRHNIRTKMFCGDCDGFLHKKCHNDYRGNIQ
jgi:hypothetical protein